jgi:hypothetical protein
VKIQLLCKRAKCDVYRNWYYAIRWTRRVMGTAIRMYPIHSPSPTIATLPGGSYLAHRRRAFHLLFIQSSFRQDALDLFQDRLIRAIVLFRERKAIAPQKFPSVVTALTRLLSPIFTCNAQNKLFVIVIEKRSRQPWLLIARRQKGKDLRERA